MQLIEVKDRKEPYQGFRRADRDAMRSTYLPDGAERLMVNKRGSSLTWYDESEWP